MSSSGDIGQRLSELSTSARRLLDYVAVLPGGAGYALLRHLARVTEEDMVVDLREAVDAGVLAAVAGRPNVYNFVDNDTRNFVLDSIGPDRMQKLRSRAEAARFRVEGL